MSVFDAFPVFFPRDNERVEHVVDADAVFREHLFFELGVVDDFLDGGIFEERFDRLQVRHGQRIDDIGAAGDAQLDGAERAWLGQRGLHIEGYRGMQMPQLGAHGGHHGRVVDPNDRVVRLINPGAPEPDAQRTIFRFKIGRFRRFKGRGFD